MKTKKIFLLFCTFSLGVISTIKAQFATSSQLYFYEFVESSDNGMKSYSRCTGGSEYYVLLFRNNCTQPWGTSKDDIASHILKNDVIEHYYNFLDRKNYLDKDVIFSYGNIMDFLLETYKYHRAFSSGTKYTYRKIRAAYEVDVWNNTIIGKQPVKGHWTSGGKDLDECYTFSIDKKEMIKWKASSPDKRDYYKLIDVNSLKPNMDFLY